MPHTVSQTFLRELDKKLWTAADRLRSNLDAAAYKYAVLGLIFLKYVSDSFAQRQAEIEAMVRDPENDFFIDPADYAKPKAAKGRDTGIPACSSAYDEAIAAELEERDYYIEKNVFWVPALARWKTLQDSAKLPAGTEITVKNGKTTTYKITSTGKLIDDALEAVEKENTRNGDLRIASSSSQRRAIRRSPLPNLAGLIDLIATIPFQHADLHADFVFSNRRKFLSIALL
jgi:type I restriction enzyme M protein